ncbi:four helix bundle protein [Solitalea longa]|uniref:Four helix bundle protein n=1 Tax=Solitalea longa TaxID=2079460 RepID=A0A2S5A326_9SPHI|nr:four helix bundle protein [Solitalea longa]POY36717.1 four helix bundle protein [Solitalea longa]
MRNDKDNLIVTMTFKYSLEIIEYTEQLELLKKFNMANQLFRSGTSIGANVWEAQNAESKADFIHKMKVAAKEADETEYWLKLCTESSSYPRCDKLINKLEEVIKILSKIISSSKKG